MDSGDATPWDTACREANEEIGIGEDDLIPLGYLPPEDVLVSGFKVVPVMARGSRPLSYDDFNLNSSEVSRLILCDPQRISSEPAVVEGEFRGMRYEYPVYPLENGLKIWGATARILRRVMESGILY